MCMRVSVFTYGDSFCIQSRKASCNDQQDLMLLDHPFEIHFHRSGDVFIQPIVLYVTHDVI